MKAGDAETYIFNNSVVKLSVGEDEAVSRVESLLYTLSPKKTGLTAGKVKESEGE